MYRTQFSTQNIFYHPTDSATLFAFDSSGLKTNHFSDCPKSLSDSGWHILKSSAPGKYFCILPEQPNILFYTANDSLWRSNDGGTSWTLSAPAAITNIAYFANTNLFFGTAADSATKGFFLSVDSGRTFVRRDTTAHFAVCVDSANHAVYLGKNNELQRSDDSGRTFYSYNNAFSQQSIVSVAANVYGKLLCAMSDALYQISRSEIVTRLIAPQNDTLWIPQPLTLQWSVLNDANHYRVQIATDSLFTNIIIDDSAIVATSRATDSLLPNTKYFWRVRAAINPPSIADWSQVWSFITQPLYPTQVALLYPGNDTLIEDTRVDFSWTLSQNEILHYWFEIADNDSFATPLIDSTLAQPAMLMYEPLVPQTYWWRVRGGNSSGWGPFSAAYHFTMISKTGVHENYPSDATMSLENFPNPFSTTTEIFPKTTSPITSLKIFDALGRAVADLSAQAQRGNTPLQFNAEHFPTGMYNCVMQCGEVVYQKKILLMR